MVKSAIEVDWVLLQQSDQGRSLKNEELNPVVKELAT